MGGMGPMHIEMIPPPAMAGMNADMMGNMPPYAMGGMGPQHMEHMPPEAMAGMHGPMMHHMPHDCMGGMGPQHMEHMPHDCMCCGPQHMEMMPPPAMAGMTNAHDGQYATLCVWGNMPPECMGGFDGPMMHLYAS